MNTDRIARTIMIGAPRSTVWRALTTADQFGAWFGAQLNGTFSPGGHVTGRITSPGYDHLSIKLVIERVEPEYLMSYRWHPYAIDPNVDYSSEPATLCEFTLEKVSDGTKLTVIESGFDRIPAERRDVAFRMNDGGWAAQLANIARYLAGANTPA